MNNVVWLPDALGLEDSDGRCSPRHALSFGFDVPAQPKHTGLCIPCALTNHDFKQRMPARATETLDEEPMPKAWVDGRRYRMMYYAFSNRPVCGDCGDKAYIVYEPEL